MSLGSWRYYDLNWFSAIGASNFQENVLTSLYGGEVQIKEYSFSKVTVANIRLIIEVS
jgi:hypothetical protein